MSIIMQRISFNIGGIRFETEEATLRKFPESRLAQEYSGVKEIFYDRNPYIFSFILDCYRYGSLHLPHDICSTYLQAEVDFLRMPLDVVQPCCLRALYAYDDDLKDIEYIAKNFPHLNLNGTREEIPHKSTFSKVWTLVDDAKSSRLALIYALVLLSCTMALIIIDALRSINVCQERFMPHKAVGVIADYLGWNSTHAKLTMLSSRPVLTVRIVYWVCSLLLCIDTVLRLIFCPNKCLYFKNIFNIGEIVYLLGFIIRKSVFSRGGIKLEHGPHSLGILICLYAIGGTKVAKLFRLGLNIPSVKLMHLSLVSSYRELLFLLMLFIQFTSVIGPLVYLVEFTENGNINDMFTSFWWAAVTMTTVGYGDHYPVTAGGRAVGALCAVMGVLLLAMPIGILASSFNGKHSNYQLVDKHSQRRRRSTDTFMRSAECIN